MDPKQFTPPLVAILRGLTPAEAQAAGQALFDAGFRLLEVPLNRPGALESIAILSHMAPADAIVGGGTMLTVAHECQATYAIHADALGGILRTPRVRAVVAVCIVHQ